MALEIIQLEVGLISNFCEVIGCTETGRAALVDPAFEVDRLLGAARERSWTVDTILLTHSHLDHIAGLEEAATATGAIVRCHPLETDRAREHATRVGPVADREHVPIGAATIQALYTPGHTPGCICWYAADPGAVITGDVLFVASAASGPGAGCGAVSFADSDPAAMFHSLQQVLGALPEQTRIYPGHDYGPTPTSTLAWELAHNPALRADTLEAFLRHKKLAR